MLNYPLSQLNFILLEISFRITVVTFFLLLLTSNLSGQSEISGTIDDYYQEKVRLMKLYGDTMFQIGVTETNKNGRFLFSKKEIRDSIEYLRKSTDKNIDQKGIFKIELKKSQYFFLISDNKPIQIKTTFKYSPFYNIATDSMEILRSKENEHFYDFQRIYKKVTIADEWLLKMMRLYPKPDPFHEKIKATYFKRHASLNDFIQNDSIKKSISLKIALAFQERNPNWEQPDSWRDSIKADYFFENFNPSDSFYLQSNILPVKMNQYLKYRSSRKKNKGLPMNRERIHSSSAIEFLNKTKVNSLNFEFCLNYYLGKFSRNNENQAFLALYNKFLKEERQDCGTMERDGFSWARKRADVIKGLQIGASAPDFSIIENKINLHQIQSDRVLLIFWASWCSHCRNLLPDVKSITDSINQNPSQNNSPHLTTVSVSLDHRRTQWHNFIQQHDLHGWLNISNLKGWDGEIAKKYNIYATPTFIILNKNKQIISKPRTLEQLQKELTKSYP